MTKSNKVPSHVKTVEDSEFLSEILSLSPFSPRVLDLTLLVATKERPANAIQFFSCARKTIPVNVVVDIISTDFRSKTSVKQIIRCYALSRGWSAISTDLLDSCSVHELLAFIVTVVNDIVAQKQKGQGVAENVAIH